MIFFFHFSLNKKLYWKLSYRCNKVSSLCSLSQFYFLPLHAFISLKLQHKRKKMLNCFSIMGLKPLGKTYLHQVRIKLQSTMIFFLLVCFHFISIWWEFFLLLQCFVHLFCNVRWLEFLGAVLLALRKKSIKFMVVNNCRQHQFLFGF